MGRRRANKKTPLNVGSTSVSRLPATARTDTRTAALIVSVAVFALLIPFLGRAFHIDDPLFLWAARHIQAHPADPYGFTLNWYGTGGAMSEITKNPPLTSYYIAFAAGLFGWSEFALHAVFMVPALMLAIGTLLLARRFCAHPVIATLAALLTPVFAISSLTVMSDVLMLGFWVLAVHFWMKGVDTNDHLALAGSGLLVALSSLTKYFGMALIPLLLVYALVRQRRVGWWLLYLLIPVAILAWYQWITHRLYGRGLLLDAAAYATDTETGVARLSLSKFCVTLAFTGGCVASVLFFAGQLWSRRVLIFGLLAAGVVALVVYSNPQIGAFRLPADSTARGLFAVQFAIWGAAGASLIALATIDLNRHRDANSLFLFLWLAGTFVFAGFVNWTTNGRSLLPMMVPAGMLIARRLEVRNRTRDSHIGLPSLLVPLALSAGLSIAVAWADSRFAETGRTGAATIIARYPVASHRVWFEGHWGFQYYMEQLGAVPVDLDAWRSSEGDIVVLPTTNTNVFPLPSHRITFQEAIDLPAGRWLTTMSHQVGAGFYADVYGPLPFVFGAVPAERFTVSRVLPR